MTAFTPLPLKAWPNEMRAAIEAMTPPNPRHPKSVRGGRPKALNILGSLAHHPALAHAFFTFNGHILRATTLSLRERELIVLRTAAVRRSSYEWAQHVVLARDVGIHDEELAWIVWGPDAPNWEDREATLLRSVDELIDAGAIQADTLTQLAESYSVQQILDLIFTVGSYEMLGWMLQSFGVELDDDIRSALNLGTQHRPT